MHELASEIRGQLDTLYRLLEQRMRDIEGYAELPDGARLDSARRDLDLVAACLEDEDDSGFRESIEERTSEWLVQGRMVVSLMQVLSALEETLLPLITDVRGAKFLWQMLSDAQRIVLAADIASRREGGDRAARPQEGMQVDVTQHRRAEEELRESQRMLRSVLDNIPISVFWKGENLTFLGCNRQFAESAQLDSPEDIVGKTDFDLWWSGQAEQFQRADYQVLEAGEPLLNQELSWADGRGGRVWRRFDKIPLRDENGEIWALLGLQHDITERKRAEQELRESQQMLQLIMDNIPQRVFWKSRDLVYLGCNHAFVEQRGLASSDDVVGKTDFDLSGKEQAERFRADDLYVMETGEAKLNYEEPQTTADDQQRWLRTSKVPLRDAEGEVWGVLGMYEDITERKQTEIELQRLARAVEATHDAVVITDLEGNIQFVNTAFEELTGYSRQEAIEENPRILKSGQQPDEVYTAMWQAITSGDAWQGEVTNRRKDGTFYEAQLTVSPVRGAGGEVEEFVAIQRDVSERTEIEREREQVYARRDEQVRAAVEVSQELAAVPELGELFRRVVTVIKERFGYYHAQIFRYEPALDAVVLVTGYGEPGERMLAEGHSLPMRRGVVGIAAATRESVLARDTSQEPGWVPNPHLPDTRGELAVPIKLRDRVLGIIDVQSDVAGALDEDDRLLLESLSGPIALAIESTTLRQEMEDNLRELAAVQRALSQEGWGSFQQTGELPEGYLFDRMAVRPASDLWEPEIRRAMQSRFPVISDRRGAEREIGVGVAPIIVQNEPVGVLGVYQEPDNPLSPEDLDLVRQVSEQVAAALENARLAAMTQDALAEARTLYRFGELVSGETDVEAVYGSVAQSLVMELGYAASFIGVLGEDAESLQEVARVTVDDSAALRLGTSRQGIAFIAVRRREPVLINDPLDDEWLSSEASEGRPFRLAAVPVFTEEEVLGVIGVSRPLSEAEITDRDIRILEAVAIQAANAIRRAQLFEQTQQALSAADAATQRYLRDTWEDFLSGRAMESEGYLASPEGVAAASDLWLPEMERALEGGEAVSVVAEPGDGSGRPRSALAIPLKTRGQVIGVVDFFREGTSEGWTEREQELIQALVDQIGDSVESERQFAQTQATLAETERMYRASQRISAAQNTDEILQVVLDMASSTSADQAVVFMFDRPVTSGLPESQSMVAFWDRAGIDPPAPLGTRYTIDEYPLVRQVSRDGALAVSDVQADDQLDSAVREGLGRFGFGAVAIIPMSVGNEWLGYSAILTRNPHLFTAGEMRIYESVHDQAATALRSARLYQEAQSRARREQLIREITSKMRGTPDLDTILNTAVQELGRALGVSRAFVRLSTGPSADAQRTPLEDEPVDDEA
jgi:PAS domain S-box-containing protein